MNESNYYQKYLKYKMKYLNLNLNKNLIVGKFITINLNDNLNDDLNEENFKFFAESIEKENKAIGDAKIFIRKNEPFASIIILKNELQNMKINNPDLYCKKKILL